MTHVLTQRLTATAYLAVGSDHCRLAKSKEEVYHTDFGAIGKLKAQAWHRCTVWARQLREDLG